MNFEIGNKVKIKIKPAILLHRKLYGANNDPINDGMFPFCGTTGTITSVSSYEDDAKTKPRSVLVKMDAADMELIWPVWSLKKVKE